MSANSGHPHIACVQMNSSDNVAHNLDTAEHLMGSAVAKGAQLVVLPESFAFMGKTMQEQFLHAEKFGQGPIQARLSEIAKTRQCWIVAGTIAIKSGDKLSAACLVYNAQGEVVARYDKMHLFDVDLPNVDESYRESSVYEAGQEVVVIDSPVGRLGLSVCYDIRFPEFFRQQLDLGMQVLAVPAAFTQKTGVAHWHTLLRARAVENLCYVAAAAQVGEHVSQRETYGHSLVYGPWGELLSEQPQGEGSIACELNLQRQAVLREEFPALRHRRL